MYEIKNGYEMRVALGKVGGRFDAGRKVWTLTDEQHDALYAMYTAALSCAPVSKGYEAATITRVDGRSDSRNGVSEGREVDGYMVDGGEDN
jgi:hypothetical protein